MDNNMILKEIDKAVKAIVTPTELGSNALLNPQQFDNFVREIQDATVILQEARYQEMDAHKVEIDRIGFVKRVLEKGGADIDELSTSDFASPSTNENVLSAEELMAVVGLKDHTVRRNIERGNLEQTIVTLLGEAAGRDMEEWAIFANEDVSAVDHDNWSAIDLTDAWLVEAGNKLFNDTSGSPWDDTADNWPENLFQALLASVPKKYLQVRSDWRIYVTWDIEDAYRDLLKARGTLLGDNIQTQHPPVAYKGIPVVYVPMLERGQERVAMLQHPDNMVWGIFHEVTLETEREAKKRRTDFVLTFEGDAGYEDENACVVAIDEDEASSDYSD